MRKELNSLATWAKTMISLDELTALLHTGGQTYEELAELILEFEQDNFLQAVKTTGRTTRLPEVAYQYRIMKVAIKEDFYAMLYKYNQRFHSAMRLDRYYILSPEIFHQDLPFLERINTYLNTYNFPEESVPAPERSAELVDDEKWLDEKGGKELLERVQIWEAMRVIPVSDPLMMAVHAKVLHNPCQYHLIVENKTTYQALVAVLPETIFSTLIYGSGNKIIKSIEQFDWQLPTGNVVHTFYYFGDIDRSGLTIWYLLNEKQRVIPAFPFYEACIQKQPFKGKTNQRLDGDAIRAFVSEMPHASKVEKLLDDGLYYPQEVLKSAELGAIWREWSWSFTNGKD